MRILFCNERREKMYLRSLEVDDAKFLCSIFADNEEYYKIFYDPEKNLNNWRKRIQRFLNHKEWKHYIVIAEETKPIGWFGFIDEGDKRSLIIIVFKKEYSHQGYGTLVMHDFIADCKKSNVKTVYLNVNEDNSKAIKFYQKLGFQVYDTEVTICNDKTENKELKMKLELGDI